MVAAEVNLSGDAFHHLVQVCRLRINDEILLLNGQGKKAVAFLQTLSKRELTLKVVSVEEVPATSQLDALILVPKKDALELMLKMSVELGFRKVMLLRGAYSQERLPDEARLQSLLQSAIEQSNNPWPPEVILLKDWSEVVWNQYQHVLCFDPTGESGEQLKFKKTDGILTLIGPEGGFSPEELTLFQELSNAKRIAWQTPIMRAPTALGMATGWVTARMA